MTDTLIMTVVKDALAVSLKVAGPFLLVAIVLGLVISIIQATTQIQEQTLTFVPKLLGIAAMGLFLGSWMLHTVMGFTERIFEIIARITM
ncbi:MAG: flagellar biosynthesis protein FliQ [Sarcina sp.]